METPNSIIHLAHVAVHDREYNVAISLCTASRRIHVFKYNDHCCDYEQFDNQHEACEFLEKPLYRPPKLTWNGPKK